MTNNSRNSTTVKARESLPRQRPNASSRATDEENGLNPPGRSYSDIAPKRGLFDPKVSYTIGTLNCRSLNSTFSREELNLHTNTFNLQIVCIQEHRLVHRTDDPEFVAHDIGKSILFTSSAYRNNVGAAVGGVGFTVQKHLLPLLTSIKKVNERTIIATFNGNPKTVLICCHSPHNLSESAEVEEFYTQLNNCVSEIPAHNMLIIGGDFNAQIRGKFSYHQSTNRNGELLEDFLHQNNLLAGNTLFQKPKRKLWTWRHPSGYLSQIDFILYRKRWRNSIHDCQAHTSSVTIGGDHNIVTANIKLSLRSRRKPVKRFLYWRALAKDNDLAKRVDELITTNFESLSDTKKTYTSFAKICNEIGLANLPSRPPQCRPTVENAAMITARKNTVKATTLQIPACQNTQRSTFDKLEDERINRTLSQFENNDPKEAWRLVKILSGKKKSVTFIQGKDRLNIWKNHFQNLLSTDNESDSDFHCEKIYDIHPEISTGEFSTEEINKALTEMKPGKAPGLDGLTLELWKLPKVREYLRDFCIQTFNGQRPDEWGMAGIVPIPKKGDLTICSNYRGISLSQIAAKVYNRLILNRIRPVVDKLIRPTQNGFRPARSTSSHLLALRRLLEEIRNHKKEAAIIFIDFKKAFDSIDRSKMFKILLAYGIPPKIVDGIRVMYENTSALVMTPEGNSDIFLIDIGVLQGDPLAHFLFVICLDYALRIAIDPLDGITLKRRRSRRYPEEALAELAYADDIALMENSLLEAESLIHKIESATQSIGLYLNAGKTKFIHINPTSDIEKIHALNGDEIDKVEDFQYLGGFIDSSNDINIRIGKAWGALNALSRVWESKVKKSTKIKVFKAAVESILLYGCESWPLTKTLSLKVDGTYTRMLRRVLNISWKSHVSNKDLYGSLPKLTEVIRRRRLALAGHIARHAEPAARLLLWSPEEPKRRGRPAFTLKNLLAKDTGLNAIEMATAMSNRDLWRKNYVMSPVIGCT